MADEKKWGDKTRITVAIIGPLIICSVIFITIWALNLPPPPPPPSPTTTRSRPQQLLPPKQIIGYYEIAPGETTDTTTDGDKIICGDGDDVILRTIEGNPRKIYWVNKRGKAHPLNRPKRSFRGRSPKSEIKLKNTGESLAYIQVLVTRH